MKFISGINELEFTTRHSYPYKKRKTKVQSKDYTASMIPIVESFEVETNIFTISFKEMTTTELEGLLDWHDSIADGMSNEFTVIDDLGNQFVARFASSEIRYSNVAYDLYSVSFDLENVENP